MSCEYLDYKKFTKKKEIENYFLYIKDKNCCTLKNCMDLAVEKARLKMDCEQSLQETKLCKEIEENLEKTRESVHDRTEKKSESMSKKGGKKNKRKTKRRKSIRRRKL